MVCCTPKQIDSWTVHPDGVAALLRQAPLYRRSQPSKLARSCGSTLSPSSNISWHRRYTCRLAQWETSTLGDLRQRQRPLDTISRMAIGICSGAPTQMGLFTGGLSAGSLPCLSPLNGVFRSVLPLAVAECAAGAPNEVHKWVDQSLEKIGHTTGIQRALKLIPKLEQLRGWKIQQHPRRKQQRTKGDWRKSVKMLDK